MLKKWMLLISVLSITIYLLLWAWVIRWIDQDRDVGNFITEKKYFTLEVAKFVWKITPALDREKDAERLLKIAEWSTSTNLKNLNSINQNMKTNYYLVSDYYKKHSNRMGDKLKNKFILQKLIFMNRSFREVKDNSFEKEIYGMILNRNYNNNDYDIGIKWITEIMWFIIFHEYTYRNDEQFDGILKDYVPYFVQAIMDVDKKYNTNISQIVFEYTFGLMFCYRYNEFHDVTSRHSNEFVSTLSGLDEKSTRYLKTINTTQFGLSMSKKEFELLDKFIFSNNSNYLIPLQIAHMNSHSRCKAELISFLSKNFSSKYASYFRSKFF